MRFLTFGLLCTAAVSASPFKRGHWKGPLHNDGAKAVYFLDNDPAGSSIVSMHVGKGHLLSDPARTSTDGFGSFGTNLTGFPNPADTLMGQSAVVVSGDGRDAFVREASGADQSQMLFTVNAGSNTLAMFQIDPSDPWHPQLVGSPADTLGEFPMAVAYSDALQMVCVLNGGAISGVSCFHVDPVEGLKTSGGLRSLAGKLQETTPPSGPPGSAAQVLFDPASTGVFALLKGNAGSTPPTPGAIVGFKVEQGSVSSEPIVTVISDITMEFGSVFLSESEMFLSDPSYGVSILQLGADLKFTELVHTVVPSQKALCWAEYDSALGVAYGNDAGRNWIYKFDPNTGAQEGAIHLHTDGNPADKGVFDSAIDQKSNTMYALVGANGVVTIDLKESKQTQFLDLSSFGDRQGYQGMAVY